MATLTATGLRDNTGKEGLQPNTKSPDLKGGSKVTKVQRLPLRTSERGREEEVRGRSENILGYCVVGVQ